MREAEFEEKWGRSGNAEQRARMATDLTAVLVTAREEEREWAATVALSHKKRKRDKRQLYLSDEAWQCIQDEGRSEDIAADVIAAAIRQARG